MFVACFALHFVYVTFMCTYCVLFISPQNKAWNLFVHFMVDFKMLFNLHDTFVYWIDNFLEYFFRASALTPRKVRTAFGFFFWWVGLRTYTRELMIASMSPEFNWWTFVLTGSSCLPPASRHFRKPPINGNSFLLFKSFLTGPFRKVRTF